MIAYKNNLEILFNNTKHDLVDAGNNTKTRNSVIYFFLVNLKKNMFKYVKTNYACHFFYINIVGMYYIKTYSTCCKIC